MRVIQQMQDFARSQTEAAPALAAVLVKSAERFFAETSRLVGATYSNNSDWLREIAAVRSAPEFVQVQTKHAQANYAAMIEQTQKLSAIFLQTVEDAINAMPQRPAATRVPTGSVKRAA